jgi:hypothetical protein
VNAGPERRTVWFLVPDAAGDAILVDPDGGLPRNSIELTAGETTVMGTARTVAQRWRVDLPVVELLFDPGALAGPPAGPIDALVEVEPPPRGWQPGDGSTWAPVATSRPAAPPGLRPRMDELLAERGGDRAVDPRRARWSRPGWYAGAVAWITETLRQAGWGEIRSLTQVRHWGISAVMRAEADGGTAWFKAVFPGFRHEPAVTGLLHHHAPGLVPPVLGVDEEAGWLLLADVGTPLAQADRNGSRAAIERLVRAQRGFLDRTDELLAAGCPNRPLGELGRSLEAALAHPDVGAWTTLTPARAAALVAWVEEAARALQALGIPDTLVHGDFHPGNVALVRAEAVLLDWSDAAVANPLVDVLTWIDWTRDDPELTAAVWELFLEQWEGIVDVQRFREQRNRFAGLGAAYHAVSYAGIVAGLEPSHVPMHADGLCGYLDLLDATVPAG